MCQYQLNTKLSLKYGPMLGSSNYAVKSVAFSQYYGTMSIDPERMIKFNGAP